MLLVCGRTTTSLKICLCRQFFIRVETSAVDRNLTFFSASIRTNLSQFSLKCDPSLFFYNEIFSSCLNCDSFTLYLATLQDSRWYLRLLRQLNFHVRRLFHAVILSVLLRLFYLVNRFVFYALSKERRFLTYRFSVWTYFYLYDFHSYSYLPPLAIYRFKSVWIYQVEFESLIEISHCAQLCSHV